LDFDNPLQIDAPPGGPVRRHVLSVVLLALQLPRLALAPLPVTEADAVAISDDIQGIDPSTGLRRHLPWGTIADPIYASGDPANADFTRVVHGATMRWTSPPSTPRAAPTARAA
jgi:hypothetical protein